MRVETIGAGPRLVLVHGSVGFGRAAWAAQQPLAQRFELVVVTRSGYPPEDPDRTPPLAAQVRELAALLRRGDHLVGHSYGGVVSLLAAAEAGAAPASLTLLEPPAFAVARGVPAVDDFVAALGGFFEGGPHDPRAYCEFFLGSVGSDVRLAQPLPPAMAAGARAAMAEQPPWEAAVPLEALAASGVPALVVSGGHHAAFDAVCDVLEASLAAERVVLAGAGHAIPRLGSPFNEALEAHVDRARPSRARPPQP